MVVIISPCHVLGIFYTKKIIVKKPLINQRYLDDCMDKYKKDWKLIQDITNKK